MNRKIEILLTIVLLIFFGANAFAGDIEKGTISVGASSSFFFNQTNYSGDSDHEYRSVSFIAEMGYFFIKNWEIGTTLRLYYFDNNDDSQSYALIPFIGYHWVFNKTSNLYAKAGIGYSNDSNDYFDHTESLVLGELGYEYFLTTNIAIDLGIQGERTWGKYEYESAWSDSEGHSGRDSSTKDSTIDSFTTQLKFKIYF
jgi:hypothetical protein